MIKILKLLMWQTFQKLKEVWDYGFLAYSAPSKASEGL